MNRARGLMIELRKFVALIYLSFRSIVLELRKLSHDLNKDKRKKEKEEKVLFNFAIFYGFVTPISQKSPIPELSSLPGKKRK